jgi:hypothetical protein
MYADTLIPWPELSLKVWKVYSYFLCDTEGERLEALHTFKTGDCGGDVHPSASGVNFTILPEDVDWTGLPDLPETKSRFQVIDDFSKGV